MIPIRPTQRIPSLLPPRFVLAAALALGCATMAPPVAGASAGGAQAAIGAWNGDLVVRTASGLARGQVDRGGSLSWKGLPYARPPVGELRWKAPQEPLPWKGTLNAGSFGRMALQRAPFIGTTIGSEDCLYLNVWRPAGTATGLPVYVYIHGGGNTIGAANQVDDYLGWAVAAKSGMVCVTMNYRLGPFGWFLDPSLAAGADADSASGNFGTLDIIAALRWIQANIAAFGGDPGRVTIAGESAGARNVLSLLASPRAAGLFHRAVSESGYTESVPRDKAEAAAAELLARLLQRQGRARDLEAARALAASMDPGARAAFLRGAPAKAIMALQKGGGMGMTSWPTVIADGGVLPLEGEAGPSPADWPNLVPLVIGSNKEELKLFLSFDPKLDWRSPLYVATAKYGSLAWKAAGVDRVADALASSSTAPPVYVYRFDWGAPDEAGSSPMPGDWGGRLGAFHSLEVSFFLGTESCLGPLYTGRLFTAANRPGREELTRGIMAYLASFAATGDPNGASGSLPPWPARPPEAGLAAERGEAVGLVFDATATVASFEPLRDVVTKEGVEAAIDNGLTPLFAAAVRSKILVR